MNAVSPGAQGTAGRLVVGIGASAGGLEALKALFGAMPPKTGLTFIVVIHLDPTHESLLPELLSHTTALTVLQAADRQPLAPDHVFIIPPNRILALEKGLIRVREVVERRSLRGTVDHFFRSLATDQRDNAVAIVLSGSGTEGALGARAVKAEGGLVMAQAPDTAAQPGMPANAIATGVVDLVLPPERMPDALVAYAKRGRREGPAVDAGTPEGLADILALLQARRKYDFRGYKKGMLMRRIQRRMGLQQLPSVSKYAVFLRSHPGEVDQLFKDLLIGVTSFFRDPSVFDELASRVLGDMVRQRDPDLPVRAWIPGCSTGEEAYSIAIVLAEQLAAARSSCRVQIFATDVDEHTLAIARTGTYPESIALDVSPDRLRRFFTRDDHRYTVTKSLRDWITFAAQNLTSDPPFSRLDLVSCRNVLIYLEPDLQERLLSIFHFALRPGGYLLLGNAEGIGGLEDLFAPVSKRRRIYKRVGLGTRPSLYFPSRPPARGAEPTPVPKARLQAAAGRVDQQLLAHLAPTAVVVRSSGHVVRFYGALEPYLKLPAGDATLDVLTLARDRLKPTLRAALHEAVRQGKATSLETSDRKSPQERATLRVTVRPVDGPTVAERLWLIVFEEVPAAARAGGRGAARRTPALVKQLETELRATRKEQQHLVEQLESGNEELQAANEEILSMNEELQSTNEELVTSKEELQSMNEELTTLNAQLQDKVHELTAVNDDLANLLVSTDIATVFLDTSLRIRRFTAAASRVFNLRSTDVGRPMQHMATTLMNVDLSLEAQSVLDHQLPIEREVTARDGRQYFLRGLPYRTRTEEIQGVVFTLVDVTTIKEAERALQAVRAQVDEDLRRMTRLHEASTRLAGPGDIRELEEEILRAAVDITGAEMGDIQRGDDTGVLTLAASFGFGRPFLDFFARVDTRDDSTCAVAMAERSRVVVEDVDTSPIFAGASLQVMRDAGVRAVQSTPLFDRSGAFLGMLSTHYRSVHQFTEHELRWVDLLARHAADLIERQRTADLLTLAREDLERRVAERTQWLTLLYDVSRAINEASSGDDALRRVLRRICEAQGWQFGTVYLADQTNPQVIVAAISCLGDARFLPLQAATEGLRFSRGEHLPGRAFETGSVIWPDDTQALLALLPKRSAAAVEAGVQAGLALPIRYGHDVIAVLELFSDRRHERTLPLEELMKDLGFQIGKVLERERAEAQMGDLVWREQQDILHTLHDSLGQTLTGIGMLSGSLARRLGEDKGEVGQHGTAEVAGQLKRQVQVALEQVRQLSRGLFPIDIDAAGLMPALRELAATTQAIHGIPVEVEGDIALTDGRVATQLYRIVQEAVTNVVKHAKARSIRIEAQQATGTGTGTIRIVDDGVGIRNTEPETNGLGLRIMHYRASSIGCALSVEPRPQGGTIITCSLRTPIAASEFLAAT